MVSPLLMWWTIRRVVAVAAPPLRKKTGGHTAAGQVWDKVSHRFIRTPRRTGRPHTRSRVGVGQQAHRHENTAMPSMSRPSEPLPWMNHANRAQSRQSPPRASRSAPDIPAASLVTAARTAQAMAKGNTTIRKRNAWRKPPKKVLIYLYFPLYVYYNSVKIGCKGCLRLARAWGKASRTLANRGAENRSPAFTFPPPGRAFSATRTGGPTGRRSPFAAWRCPGDRRRRRC